MHLSRVRLSQLFAVLVLAISCCASATAQSFSAPHAKVSLLAEQNSLQPGHTASIGLFFDLENGWHIYWVNPGDSGEAPRVRWNLPKGFEAGDIRWPVPARLAAGQLVDYGYQGQVLLPLELRVPASYQAGAPVTIVADVRYIVCRDVCMPAQTQARLSLPSANRAPSDAVAAHKLFQQARGNQPKPMPANWKAQARDDGRNFVLTLETGAPVPKATFFPLVGDQVDNAAAQTVTPAPRGGQIALKKSVQLALLARPIPTLKGVVVLGPDQAYEIAAPITAH